MFSSIGQTYTMLQPQSTQILGTTGSPGNTCCNQMKTKGINIVLMLQRGFMCCLLKIYAICAESMTPDLALTLQKIMNTFGPAVCSGWAFHIRWLWPLLFCPVLKADLPLCWVKWKGNTEKVLMRMSYLGNIETLPKHVGADLGEPEFSWGCNYQHTWTLMEVS